MTRFFNPYSKNKYHNEKVIVDHMTFDSVREANRYLWLKDRQKFGEIEDLQMQVKYDLIPSQKDENGRVIERAVTYSADFVYRDAKTGETVVEDVKGMRTKDYIIKRKLMLYVHGVRIKEI